MEPDPKKRIEWKDFYNHPLFMEEKKIKRQDEGFLNQSIMFRYNEDTIHDEFQKKKKEKEKN